MRSLREKVEAPQLFGRQERPVADVSLDGDEAGAFVEGPSPQPEQPVSVEAARGERERWAIDACAGDEVDGARRVEVPLVGEVGALRHLQTFDDLGNQEVQVGVALPVGMADEVDGYAVDGERNVGAVVGVETAQEQLVGFASALMLSNHEPRDRAQQVGRRMARHGEEVAVANDGCACRREWPFGDDARFVGRGRPFHAGGLVRGGLFGERSGDMDERRESEAPRADEKG